MENISLFVSIDLGSNTLRIECAIPKGRHEESLQIIYKRLWVVRLGEGFDEKRALSQPAMERAISALRELMSLIKGYDPSRIFFVTTGVVRDALNRDRFLEEIRKETGLEPVVISGEKEAGFTLTGVRTTLEGLSLPVLVCDIGGGSTEFAILMPGDDTGFFTLPLGAIRLWEKFKIPSPMSATVEKALFDFINRTLEESLPVPESISSLVATAGTPTTLASIDQELCVYDPVKVHGYRLDRSRIEEIYNLLAGMTIDERMGIKGLEPGREDIIVPGTAILLCVMSRFNMRSLTVSEGGLLEGALAQVYKSHSGVIPKILM